MKMMEGCMMCVRLIKEDGLVIHVSGVCLEVHSFHLCGLGVLK